jgi:hypothetical protein
VCHVLTRPTRQTLLLPMIFYAGSLQASIASTVAQTFPSIHLGASSQGRCHNKLSRRKGFNQTSKSSMTAWNGILPPCDSLVTSTDVLTKSTFFTLLF